MSEKIRNGRETNSTIRIDLEKLFPGKRFVGFICDKENGKAKHRQIIPNEFFRREE